MSIALAGDRVYFVTAADSGKAKRLAANPKLTLAACSATGKVLGETLHGRARLLQGHERRRARRLLRPTRSLFWSWVMYRVRGKHMLFYEVTPTAPG